MVVDFHDTIAAIGSASGPALRGVVRISGPDTIACLADLFVPDNLADGWADLRSPRVVTGSIGAGLSIPCKLLIWPTTKSYTRQSSAEIHTFGSGPLLESVLAEICRRKVRLAEPGEFTQRAFLAGRVDLTQAEAVLGVIDSRGQEDLKIALDQLAGGLSQPLSQLREQLVAMLAELEAGLDFVEDDIQFISPKELSAKLDEAQQTVASALEQLSSRSASYELPRVVLSGPPNVGKSSLFNALVELHGFHTAGSSAIVSTEAGTTRDYLVASIDLDGVLCELVDTAGVDTTSKGESIAGASQAMTNFQFRQAELMIHCRNTAVDTKVSKPGFCVLTKRDLWKEHPVVTSATACSSLTGEGVSELGNEIRRHLVDSAARGSAVASTNTRCKDSLRQADESLKLAIQLLSDSGNEELIAAEVRAALVELGRIVGTVHTDDLLDRIFSQFCIGK